MTLSKEYVEQLQKEHSGSKWGSSAVKYSGAAVAQLISRRPYLQTALDYGCGKGTLATEFPQLEWTEYDPGIPGKDVKPQGTFDLVTNTDVLEHVEPDLLDEVLAELVARTGKVLFLDIACYPTGKLFGEGPYKGQDMHLIIEPPAWWEQRIAPAMKGLQLFESQYIKRRVKGKERERAVFVYERV